MTRRAESTDDSCTDERDIFFLLDVCRLDGDENWNGPLSSLITPGVFALFALFCLNLGEYPLYLEHVLKEMQVE